MHSLRHFATLLVIGVFALMLVSCGAEPAGGVVIEVTLMPQHNWELSEKTTFTPQEIEAAGGEQVLLDELTRGNSPAGADVQVASSEVTHAQGNLVVTAKARGTGLDVLNTIYLHNFGQFRVLSNPNIVDLAFTNRFSTHALRLKLIADNIISSNADEKQGTKVAIWYNLPSRADTSENSNEATDRIPTVRCDCGSRADTLANSYEAAAQVQAMIDTTPPTPIPVPSTGTPVPAPAQASLAQPRSVEVDASYQLSLPAISILLVIALGFFYVVMKR